MINLKLLQFLQAKKSGGRIINATLGRVVCVSLMIFAGMALFGVPELIAGPGQERGYDGLQNQPFPEKPTADAACASEPLLMTIQSYVRSVNEKNEQIAYQDAEWAVTREAVKGARAIFEPVLVGTYQRQNDKRKNTVQEMINQGFAPEFWEDSYSQQLAVEELLPTGGRVRLGYYLKTFSSSVDERYGVDLEKQTVFGVTLSQPLLKNAGIETTMAGIRMAEADRDIAFHNYRAQTMRVMAEAISAYWDLYLAQRKYRMRFESQRNAEQILRDNLARLKTGRMAETEVLEAQAALAFRKSLVSEANQAIVSAMNAVRTYISSSVSSTNVEIEPVDQLSVDDLERDFTDSLARAFTLRGEYLASLKKIEKENIRLAFAKNQLWPQIDLKATYNLNGLTDKTGRPINDALERDHPSWVVGLEFRIPLGGDKKAGSEIEATKQRQRQALLEVKAVEVSLANAIDTAIRNLKSAREQVRQHAGVVKIQRRLLNTELQRFNAGKSNSRVLLEKEEELNSAREREVESLVKYTKSLYQLDLAEGSLMANQGIDIGEADGK